MINGVAFILRTRRLPNRYHGLVVDSCFFLIRKTATAVRGSVSVEVKPVGSRK
jgi:hypothetical protein